MPDVQTVLETLKAKATDQTRKTYVRHGMVPERTLGVLGGDMKLIAKSLKGQQSLAMELYATGVLEAMYVAGIVANGAKMTREEVNSWAVDSEGMPMVADYPVAWVTVEQPAGFELAMEWIDSENDWLASVGWAALAGFVTVKPNEKLDLVAIEKLLDRVAREIHGAENRVKSAMNRFLIAVGCYVAPLSDLAKQKATEIGPVSVDVGDTACKVPLATQSIAKVESTGKLGIKRATIRC